MIGLDPKYKDAVVALLKQEEINLSKLLKYFDDSLTNKHPQVDRCVMAPCPQEFQVDGIRTIGEAMRGRYNFISSTMQHFFKGAAAKDIGLNGNLLKKIDGILGYCD